MSFTKKSLIVELSLANGNFGGGGNRKRLEGFRVLCRFANLGAPAYGRLELAIFGISLSDMNQMSTVGQNYLQQTRNEVKLFAKEGDGPEDLVWHGIIMAAFVDAAAMPQVCFRISSNVTAYEANKPTEVTSIRGGADVAGLLEKLARQMGLGFENTGVTAKLADPYFDNSPLVQARNIAQAAGIVMVIDKGVMSITPAGTPRKGNVPLISAATGMIGYPAFAQNRVNVQSLLNTAVKFNGEIEIQSDLTSANGRWLVKRLDYTLESEVPNGRWAMDIEAVPIMPTIV